MFRLERTGSDGGHSGRNREILRGAIVITDDMIPDQESVIVIRPTRKAQGTPVTLIERVYAMSDTPAGMLTFVRFRQ